ncbi:MAG: hypothetical protein J7K85_08880 [Anaerolineaceae bacterium]|nr:hypothetical protein [Anaerolineaceae bacterium]
MTNKYSTRYSLRWLLFFTILFSLGCDFRYGFIESNFELGEGSTIPEWIEFKHQPNVVITNVEFTFHTNPISDNVKIIVEYTKGNMSLSKEYAGKSRYHDSTKDKPRDHYPRYIVIEVNDIDVVFIHKERGSILYVSETH